MNKEQLVLSAVHYDIVLAAGTGGWVFWPLNSGGFLDAEALRIIADELDRRDRVLFVDLPIETPDHAVGDFLDRVHE